MKIMALNGWNIPSPTTCLFWFLIFIIWKKNWEKMGKNSEN
jgi:hypothetical protein